jgi:hypothetical protein
MKFFVIVSALLVAGSAHAQHRCLDGEGRVVTSKWTCSDLGLHRAPEAVTRAPGTRACASPSTVMSLELDTKTTGISLPERLVRIANHGRARQCLPLLTELEKEILRNQYEADLRQSSMEATAAEAAAATAQAPQPRRRAQLGPLAGPAPAPVIPAGPAHLVNCDPAGCWDTNGQRHNNAAGGNFHRSDGKFCQPIGGGQVICN